VVATTIFPYHRVASFRNVTEENICVSIRLCSWLSRSEATAYTIALELSGRHSSYSEWESLYRALYAAYSGTMKSLD
jgi:hypothetical protein